MEIKAVKFRKDGFYTQPFVMGGGEDTSKYDQNIRYRGSLQNYLIDTGSEVILVDTGLPAGFPEEVPNEDSPIFTGKDICTYMEAFEALGYKPDQVTKILLTHRHADHSGEVKSFPNAKVYVNHEEMDAAELQGLTNLVPVTFSDGPYYNFPEAQKIQDGIYLIKAKGHTKGNSIIIDRCDYSSLQLGLNDSIVDLNKPVKIVYKGRTLCQGKAPRTAYNLFKTLRQREDASYSFPAVVTIKLRP